MRSSYRLTALCSLACSLILAVPLAIVTAVERGFAFMLSLMPAAVRQPAFAFDYGDQLVAYAGDCPADPALQHSMRHEAGMRRLS
jgi:hypothetical protein